MNWILVFCIYIIAVLRLDQFYNNKYFWNHNCKLQRAGTSLIQPFMELFGNSMTAHFWHFEDFIMNQDSHDLHLFECKVHSSRKSIRIFNNLPILSFFSSAFVDVNPFQTCAIIQPKLYTGKWKLVFARNLDHNLFSREKCSHKGTVKIVVDGSGCVMAQGENNELLELEIIEYCLAWQRTDILFI